VGQRHCISSDVDTYQLFLQDGLEVKDVSGIVGNPILRDWRIDPNCTAINYILCAAKPADAK
jgi:hypothetical protein